MFRVRNSGKTAVPQATTFPIRVWETLTGKTTDAFGSCLSALLIRRRTFCHSQEASRASEGAAGPGEALVTGVRAGLRAPEAHVLPCPSSRSGSLAEVGAGLVLHSHSPFTDPVQAGPAG